MTDQQLIGFCKDSVPQIRAELQSLEVRCSAREESYARLKVSSTGFAAALIDGEWIFCTKRPIGFVGWVIEPSTFSKDGAQKWYINAQGAHCVCVPQEMDAVSKSIYADHAKGYTLD